MIKQQNRRPGALAKSTVIAELDAGTYYPHALNFYSKPPMDVEINVEDFEAWALDRVQVLKAIEASLVRNKSSGENFDKSLEEVANTFLPLSTNNRKGALLHQQRKKDHISHFILRLAYCRSEELRRWFINMEAILFRMRFNNEPIRDREAFVESLHFNQKKISNEEKMAMKNELYCSSPHLRSNFENESFFEVDFERVPDIVAKRHVYLRKGKAYIAFSDQVGFIVNEFKNQLLKALEVTAKALPRMDEDHRLIPVLNNVSKQSGGREYNATGAAAGEVNADNVSNLTSHFPLCMRHLHNQLKTDGHLKHGGRLQYGLFLKGIGLSLEEALIFWRRMFTRTTDDKFRKEYAYNLRHNYGMEGKRTDYTPFSCEKIIRSNQPSSGDHHGCPFRHFSPEALRLTLSNNGVPDSSVREILDLAKNTHYNIACTRFFELTRPKVSDSLQPIGGTSASLFETITHPNQYFDQSYKDVPKLATEYQGGAGGSRGEGNARQ